MHRHSHDLLKNDKKNEEKNNIIYINMYIRALYTRNGKEENKTLFS